MSDTEKQDGYEPPRVDVTAAPANANEEFVPDGGRQAWTVIFGSTLALFASAGMLNTYVCSFPLSACCSHDELDLPGDISRLLQDNAPPIVVDGVHIPDRLSASFFPLRFRPSHWEDIRCLRHSRLSHIL